MEQQQMQFEEAEQILSWRDMQPGVYSYQGIEYRGTNDDKKPISVVTLNNLKFYAPPSLYWELIRRPETRFVKYEGVKSSGTGYQYPAFKYAK